MQQTQDAQIIQSTTIKTIKELKKLGESRNFDDLEPNESTLSGKATPEDEKCKTQYSKIKLKKKVSLGLYQKPESSRQIPDIDDGLSKSNTFKRGSQRITTMNRLQQKPLQQQVYKQNEIIDMNIALALVLQKSKGIREELESMQLTQIEINKYIKDDKFFLFSYQAMLDKLVQAGKLQNTLTNIQKPALMQIESFVINFARKQIQKRDLNQQITDKSKMIDNMFAKYQRELTIQEENMKLF